MTRAVGWRSWLAVAVVVVVAALAFRVGPALRGYHPSPDAGEYLLVARALAAGEGFTLPIRVRHLDAEPVVHPAWTERAPLWPALLALPVAAGVGGAGWPDPRLQLLNVALAALAALLAAGLAARLAARAGLDASAGLRAGVAAGLLVAWSPFLTRASIHLWAEPLGLVLVLAGLLAWTGAERGAAEGEADAPEGPAAAAAAGQGTLAAALAGVCLGLARFARPEGWVLVPLALAFGWRRLPRRAWASLGLALLVVNLVGVALSGVLAPQLFLLAVDHFGAASQVGPAASPTLGTVVGGALSNLAGQLYHLALPKYGFGWLVLPLAALAARRAALRGACLVGAALTLATAAVWSTHDPYRFTIAPFCVWACAAAVEVERRCQGRRRLWLAYALTLVASMAYAGSRELRDGPPPGPPAVVDARRGEVIETADPWSHALLTGQPARLAPLARGAGRQATRAAGS